MSSKLDDYRNEINQIDEALYQLYKKRLDVSRKVGAYKQAKNLPVLDRKREQVISLNLQEKYHDDIDLNAYLDLHETMMRVSRNAQYPFLETVYHTLDSLEADCVVGYQGVSDPVINTLFPNGEKKMFATFSDVFEAIESGAVKYGVVPLENSVHGEIVEVFDLLKDHAVSIAAEVIQPIEHDKSDGVEHSTMRFIIISKESVFLKKTEKTSILVKVDCESGTLAQVLAQLRYENINMLKITTRPIPDQTWRYQFFIDFEGSVCDEKVQHLLQRLQAEVYEIRLLGSYPIFKL